MASDPTLSASALRDALLTRYLVNDDVAVVLWLALKMGKPVLLEGPPGVGKTDLACALAESLKRPLFRLQCYEGLDASRALFDWDYGKQILVTQIVKASASSQATTATTASESPLRAAIAEASAIKDVFYTEDFLVERPLLAALRSATPAVMLIDEVDRADVEFEAFLLEYLAETQVTIPELGTVRAKHPPLTVLTTNATRELSDAMRRRCLHIFLDYPPPSQELRIVELRVPGIAHTLADSLVRFLAGVRTLDLKKAPSVAETIDWARALMLLGRSSLSEETVRETLAVFLKHDADKQKVEGALGKLLAGQKQS